MGWFTKRRIAKLKRRLEIVQAKWDHELWLMRNTGYAYPIALSRIAAERAELMVEIRKLEGPDVGG